MAGEVELARVVLMGKSSASGVPSEPKPRPLTVPSSVAHATTKCPVGVKATLGGDFSEDASILTENSGAGDMPVLSY